MSHSLYLSNHEPDAYSQHSVHVGVKHMGVSGNHERAKKEKSCQAE